MQKTEASSFLLFSSFTRWVSGKKPTKKPNENKNPISNPLLLTTKIWLLPSLSGIETVIYHQLVCRLSYLYVRTAMEWLQLKYPHRKLQHFSFTTCASRCQAWETESSYQNIWYYCLHRLWSHFRPWLDGVQCPYASPSNRKILGKWLQTELQLDFQWMVGNLPGLRILWLNSKPRVRREKRTGTDFLHSFHRDFLEYKTTENMSQYRTISGQRVNRSNAMMPLDSPYAKNLARLEK